MSTVTLPGATFTQWPRSGSPSWHSSRGQSVTTARVWMTPIRVAAAMTASVNVLTEVIGGTAAIGVTGVTGTLGVSRVAAMTGLSALTVYPVDDVADVDISGSEGARSHTRQATALAARGSIRQYRRRGMDPDGFPETPVVHSVVDREGCGADRCHARFLAHRDES